jgi:hypothetical protein
VFPRNARSFQCGKEVLFFLPVMTAIGEYFEELEYLPDMLSRNLCSTFDIIAYARENVEDYCNRLMLLLQLPCGIHRRVLSGGVILKQD